MSSLEGEVTATVEAQIRELIEAQAKAIRAKDVAGSLANHAADVVMFDVVNPLQYRGLKAARDRTEEWFATFDGPIGFEQREMVIAASGDVAFSHSLNHVSATTKDGNRLDMFWRATVGYRKINGKWTITHGHSSVPFDTQTGKASLDLKP